MRQTKWSHTLNSEALRTAFGNFSAAALFLWFAQPHFQASIAAVASLWKSFDWMTAMLVVRILSLLSFEWLKVVLFLKRGPVKGARSSILNRTVAAIATFLLLVPAPGTKSENPVLLCLTALLASAGMWLGFWAAWHLRNCFSIFPEARGLVTSGPYSFVRHPMYLGYWIAAIGTMISYRSWIFACVVVVDAFFQVWRARTEERALTAVFPEYAEYAARTPMFVPIKPGAVVAAPCAEEARA